MTPITWVRVILAKHSIQAIVKHSLRAIAKHSLWEIALSDYPPIPSQGKT
ncbi:hypothetical protein [Cylindrospermopsis raciborskii]|nr:hypothetical protein [Cylindrospermopsis raciborskii]